MKFKKKALLVLMVASLAGGVATAAALTYNAANKNIEGETDGAIYLKWGHNSLSNIGDLVSGVAQYQDIVLDADKSSSVTGTADVTFTLSTIDADSTLTGLSIAIYTGNLGTAGVAEMGEAISTLSSSTLTYTDKVSFTENTANKNYRLAILYDGSMAETGKTIEGRITIGLAHGA